MGNSDPILPAMEKKKWFGSIVASLLLCIALALVYEFARHWWSHNFVVRTIDFVIVGLASRSGLSLFLVKGLVILLTIPFFWAVAKYTHGLLWLRGVGPSLRLYRNPYGLVIVGYVGLFFIAMYFASLDAYAYKWCADTPEGIRTFDAAGIDPIYGIPLKPCAFEQIVALRKQQKGFTGAQRIQIGNPREFEFFDSITGKPRVWFYKAPDSGYEFYDRPGKHPGTGQDLRPVDRETVQELVRLQELANAQQSAKELQERQLEAEQAAAGLKREHQALMERYINTAVVKPNGIKVVAILMQRESQDSFSSVEDALVTSFPRQGIETVPSFFKPPFVLEGRARRLVTGDWSEATRLDLSKRVDYVVSGSDAVAYSSSSQFEGLITADLQVQLKCLNVVAQRVCGSRTVNAKGAGYTKAAALENAATNTKSLFEAFVKTLQLD
jgi:hypothetical protein